MAWKMDAKSRANRRKWVEALLSGKYKQVDGALHKEGAFCCLGVACDLSKLGRWKEYDDERLYYLGSVEVLPRAVEEWLGVNGENPRLVGEEAAELNDMKNFSFAEIATAILFEEQYQSTDGDVEWWDDAA